MIGNDHIRDFRMSPSVALLFDAYKISDQGLISRRPERGLYYSRLDC